MAKPPVIGTHLASLNLFREPDGTFEITVADAGGAIADMTPQERGETRPIDFVEPRIIQAADRMRARRGALITSNRDHDETPIPMVLHCPKCHQQHIDVATAEWDNPPHRSHACQTPGCGTIWRPADVATAGVATIGTRGKSDNWFPDGTLGMTDATKAKFCGHCGAPPSDHNINRPERSCPKCGSLHYGNEIERRAR